MHRSPTSNTLVVVVMNPLVHNPQLLANEIVLSLHKQVHS